MTNTTIKINNTRPTDLEFDVAIHGLNEQTLPNADVRFVVANADGKYNLSVKCMKAEGINKWLAKIPALNLAGANQSFRVEVIVDGYYFEPAAGGLILISEPKVGMMENTVQPMSVSASFQTEQHIDATEAHDLSPDVIAFDFRPDHKFGDAARMFTSVLRKVANVLDNAIAKDGMVQNVNKPALAKALSTLKQAFDFFYSKIESKKTN